MLNLTIKKLTWKANNQVLSITRPMVIEVEDEEKDVAEVVARLKQTLTMARFNVRSVANQITRLLNAGTCMIIQLLSLMLVAIMQDHLNNHTSTQPSCGA
jgi:hypothetical protein